VLQQVLQKVMLHKVKLQNKMPVLQKVALQKVMLHKVKLQPQKQVLHKVKLQKVALQVMLQQVGRLQKAL
jgi:hypothetical protein